MTDIRNPKIGDLVHFTMHEGRHIGTERPAIVVQTWGGTTVNLQVFTDGENDAVQNNANTIWITSAQHVSAHPFSPAYTWHWPEE